MRIARGAGGHVDPNDAAEHERQFHFVKGLCETAAGSNAWQRNTALVVAAEHGHMDIVQYLCNLPLTWGVDPGYHDSAALVAAAARGDLRIVQFLCDLPRVRNVHPGAEQNAPLLLAAEEGHLHVVQYLCELPADRGVVPGACHSAALRSAARGGHLDIVQYLCQLPVERGVVPAACRSDALHSAALEGHLDIVQFLCELPRACRVGDMGRVLIAAAQRGHAPIVQYLCELPLERGVKPDVSDNSALIYAAQREHVQVVKYLCGLPLVRGVQPGACDNEAIRYAAKNGHLHVVQSLCELPKARGVDASAHRNDAVWGVIFSSCRYMRLSTCMRIVACLYDVSSVTSVAHALPPWKLANDFALIIVEDVEDADDTEDTDDVEDTSFSSVIDAELLTLLRLVQTLPGGDQWLDHDGQFTEENLPMITRKASHRVGHALVELVRRRRVWKRRRTLCLLRALRDNSRAQPRSRELRPRLSHITRRQPC